MRTISMGFARVAILLVLALVAIPAIVRVSAAKSLPPPPTGSSFGRAYGFSYVADTLILLSAPLAATNECSNK
jgi:hypothetical protein